ncbi:MAG: 4Fe-4S binding protein [Deltaproteobacteria bacterium]|nr:4Fe-4S binding protein [Deltaproteobacteria bacterium]MBW1949944.1 4Fe-4S binding protein [Deltaproteobacteria bacterium]MBW2007359.1 4Fe-4S binding protein [Deltaproteobacteria bacterium]MBW2348878.1 4Fe-4S binding protein [Deltaproteobacteria bacterium]RLB32746.1 MAG: 4Fe-4S ferredoxin [Deltaproteobacteria bacterium]
MRDVYERLRERLDELSVGYPATRSGVEIDILKKCFTEEEAGLFIRMGMRLETPDQIAKRAGLDVTRVAHMLHGMAEKGLVFRKKRRDGPRYGAMAFAVGWYELQLGRMDREFAELVERYWEEKLHRNFAMAGSLLRPVPVNRSVDARLAVAPYEDCRKMVESQKFLAVAECICRKQQRLLGTGCDKPLEVCLVFGSHGQAYVDLGLARTIDVTEALEILDRAEKAGLVPQPGNLENTTAICNCCGDCCGVLRSLNRLDKPAQAVLSNFFMAVDPDLCTGCAECVDRCQMGAVTVSEDEVASVNLDRCIGCGLCVTTCPTEACRLVEKPEDMRRTPPKDGVQMYAAVARQRGIPLEKLL